MLVIAAEQAPVKAVCVADFPNLCQLEASSPCPVIERIASATLLSQRRPGVQSLDAGVQDLRCKRAAAATQAATAALAPAPTDPPPPRDPRPAPEPRQMPWLSFDMAAIAMAALLAATPPGRVPVITAELLHEAVTHSRPNSAERGALSEVAQGPGGAVGRCVREEVVPLPPHVSGMLPYGPPGSTLHV